MNDEMRRPAPETAGLAYAEGNLDRAAAFRDDPKILGSLRSRPEARAVVIARDQPAFAKRAEGLEALHSLNEAEALGLAQAEVFLGLAPGGAPRFAYALSDDAVELRGDRSDGFLDRRELAVAGREDILFVDVRSVAVRALVDPPTVSLLGFAKAMLGWHARHGFCANCGRPTLVVAGGWRRECPSCNALHFPRTDPVVIMLCVDGETCLLGRQARFPKGFYSCLAGFMEPGETIEDAVKREVAEEAGIACVDVSYAWTQPWPFPSSLMIGCFARAATTDIVVDKTELEDARWFSRQDVRLMLEGRHPDGLLAPQKIAIARTLMAAWAEHDFPFSSRERGEGRKPTR